MEKTTIKNGSEAWALLRKVAKFYQDETNSGSGFYTYPGFRLDCENAWKEASEDTGHPVRNDKMKVEDVLKALSNNELLISDLISALYEEYPSTMRMEVKMKAKEVGA